MPRGYRLVIAATWGITSLIALGTGAFVGSLYSPNHKQYQAVTDGHGGDNDYAGPSQSLRDISGLPGVVERAIANPRSPGGADHEKRDLAAQEATALWAFWMVVASFSSVFITAIGTIFLYKQIVLTRKAVEDTGLATEAMRESNRIAGDALSGNRPWIGQIPFQIIRVIDGSIEDSPVRDSLVFIPKWKNWGTSPAVEVSFAVAYKMVPVDRVDLERFEPSQSISEGFSFIGPSQEVSGGEFGLKQDEVNRWRAREAVIFMTGTVYYRDVRNAPDAARHETTIHMLIAYFAEGDTFRAEIRNAHAT